MVDGGREIAGQASTLGLADRIVIGVKLKARAEALASYEGLARDAGDLAGDARAFAAAVKTQNPLAGVFFGIGVFGYAAGFVTSLLEENEDDEILDAVRKLDADLAEVRAALARLEERGSR